MYVTRYCCRASGAEPGLICWEARVRKKNCIYMGLGKKKVWTYFWLEKEKTKQESTKS